jgi:hypothetical protein
VNARVMLHQLFEAAFNLHILTSNYSEPIIRKKYYVLFGFRWWKFMNDSANYEPGELGNITLIEFELKLGLNWETTTLEIRNCI